MKRFLVALRYAFLYAIPYAIGYGFGEFVGEQLHLPKWQIFICAYILLLLAGAAGGRALHWYECRYNTLDKKLYLFAILFYLIFEYLTDIVFGKSLLSNLVENLLYEFLIGLAALVVTRLVLFYKGRCVRRQFGEGSRGVLDVFRQSLPGSSSGGQPAPVFNEPLNGGAYEHRLAVQCTTGVYVGGRSRGVIYYKGIPYAKPPVGALRWKAPQPLPASSEVFQATHFSAISPQPASFVSEFNELPKSEDCLTLNIWKSSGGSTSPRPVMVFLHGGDLAFAGSACELYDGTAFARQNPDTLFVSLNYRQGILGIMDFSEVPGGTEYPDAAELPLLDQLAALKWLKENLGAFGGDPDNITLCGCDSGGYCAAILATLPEARRLFRRIVLLSVSMDCVCSQEAARRRTRRLMAYLHAGSMEELMRLPTESLVQAQDDLELYVCTFIAGRGLVPRDLLTAYMQGAAKGIDIICCSTENSMGYYLVQLGIPHARKFLHQLAEEMWPMLSPEHLRMYEEQTTWAEGQGAAVPEEAFFNQLFYHSFLLALCHAQASIGQEARYFRWRIGSPIQAFGAFSNIEVPFLLGNQKAVEKYGIVGDPRMGYIMQCALAHFMKDGNPDVPMDTVCHNDFLHWPPITQEHTPALVVEDSGVSIDEGDITGKALPLEQLWQNSPGLAVCLSEKMDELYLRVIQEVSDEDESRYISDFNSDTGCE